MNMLLSIFVLAALSGNQLPFNTTLPANPANFTQIITQNIPWFFPLILFVSFIWVDYIFGERAPELGGAKSFAAVAVAYSFFSYLIVAGGLTSSGMFFLFETIGLMGLFFETLFTQGWP